MLQIFYCNCYTVLSIFPGAIQSTRNSSYPHYTSVYKDLQGRFAEQSWRGLDCKYLLTNGDESHRNCTLILVFGQTEFYYQYMPLRNTIKWFGITLLITAVWWSCSPTDQPRPFQPVSGTLLVQSKSLSKVSGNQAKMARHLGRFVAAEAFHQILWVGSADTVEISSGSPGVEGLQLIFIDSGAAGIEAFRQHPAMTGKAFTLIISPFDWRRTVQLQQSLPDVSGELWVCTNAEFQRDALKVGKDVIVSPGRERRYLYKLNLTITEADGPLTDISGDWFRQEQLTHILARDSRGKYPEQPVTNWAPTPGLLTFYRSMEEQIDSLRNVVAETPNSVLMEIIPL